MADAQLLQQLLVEIYEQKIADEKRIKQLNAQRAEAEQRLATLTREADASAKAITGLQQQLAELTVTVASASFRVTDYKTAVVDPLLQRYRRGDVWSEHSSGGDCAGGGSSQQPSLAATLDTYSRQLEAGLLVRMPQSPEAMAEAVRVRIEELNATIAKRAKEKADAAMRALVGRRALAVDKSAAPTCPVNGPIQMARADIPAAGVDITVGQQSLAAPPPATAIPSYIPPPAGAYVPFTVPDDDLDDNPPQPPPHEPPVAYGCRWLANRGQHPQPPSAPAPRTVLGELSAKQHVHAVGGNHLAGRKRADRPANAARGGEAEVSAVGPSTNRSRRVVPAAGAISMGPQLNLYSAVGNDDTHSNGFGVCEDDTYIDISSFATVVPSHKADRLAPTAPRQLGLTTGGAVTSRPPSRPSSPPPPPAIMSAFAPRSKGKKTTLSFGR